MFYSRLLPWSDPKDIGCDFMIIESIEELKEYAKRRNNQRDTLEN
jgi:hypothetical protein